MANFSLCSSAVVVYVYVVGFCDNNAHPSSLALFCLGLSNSTIVWSNKYQDDEDVVSYCVKTKSKGERLMSKWNWYTIPKTDTLGKKMINLLSTVPGLAKLGISNEIDKYKCAAIKTYDYTKGGDKN